MAWFDLLAVHETRHMVQYDRLNRKLNRVLSILMGQSGLTIGIVLGVPDWFFEGDAVTAETLYSDTGRGRDPLFYQGMRDVVSHTDYSYQKLVNGSYRHDLPGYYEYGYFLTSYIRKTYGRESWETILDRATLLPLPSLGMYLGAKKISGTSWGRLYRQMAEDLAGRWEEEKAGIRVIGNSRAAAADPKDAVKYEALAVEEDGSILARRTSLAEPAVLVRLPPGGPEKKLMRLPSSSPVSIRGGRAVWTWHRPSTLYENRSWSDLVRVNLDTGEKRVITHKQRYLTPALSRDAARIACIEWTTEGRANLVLVDAEDGSLLRRYALPSGLFPAYPDWSEDDEKIYCTLQGEEGRAIAEITLPTGDLRIVKDFSRESVKRVRPWGDYLLYASDRSGLENIMALDLHSGKEYQVSSRLNGVKNPLAAGKEAPYLLYSEYNRGNCLDLSRQELNPRVWIPEEEIQVLPFLYYTEDPPDLNGEKADIEAVRRQAAVYTEDDIRDYSLAAGKFNVHSWGLGSGDTLGKSLSLYIRSSDIMGTTDWTLGGEYDSDDESFGTFFDLTWNQFYPVVSWENDYRFREISGQDAHEMDSSLVLSFPFNLSRDIWQHQITPFIGGGINTVIAAGDPGGQDHDFPVKYGLNWVSALPGSRRSLAPLFGINERLYFTHNPGQDEDYLFSQSSTLYLPGIFRNQSLQLGSAWENQTGGYSGRTLFSRGYDRREDDQLLQWRADYEFPLAYPDLALGSFAYIKRLRGAVFYDYTTLYEEFDERKDYRSAGVALNMDFTLFNMKYLPLSLGIRWAWLLEDQRSAVNILLMSVGL